MTRATQIEPLIPSLSSRELYDNFLGTLIGFKKINNFIHVILS